MTHPLINISKDKKLFFALFTVLSLGISMFVVPFIVSDYVFVNELNRQLERVKVDFLCTVWSPYNSTIDSYSEVLNELDSLNYVESSEIALTLYFSGSHISSSTASTEKFSELSDWYIIFGFQNTPRLSSLRVIAGDFNFSAREIGIGYKLANLLNVKVGDKITITYINQRGNSENISLVVKAIISVEGDLWDVVVRGTEQKDLPSYWTISRYNPNFALIGTIKSIHELYINLRNKVMESKMAEILNLYVILNHSEIINPPDFGVIRNKVTGIYLSINQIIGHLGKSSWIDPYISSTIDIVYWRLFDNKIGMIISNLVVGIISIVIALAISLLKKDAFPPPKETGSKGTLNKVYSFMLIILLSGLTSIPSLLIGCGLSYFLLMDTKIVERATYSLSGVIVSQIVPYLITSFCTGVIFWFIYDISVQKAIKLSYDKNGNNIFRTRFFGFSVILGVVSIIDLAFNFPIHRLLLCFLLYSFGFAILLLFPLLILLILLSFAEIYLGPVLFVYVTSLYITEKYSGKIIKFPVVRKATLSKAVFLMALALSATIYLGMFYSSMYTRTIIDARFVVGSDIKVVFVDKTSYSTYSELSKGILSIEGVNDIAVVAKLPLTYEYWVGSVGTYATVYGISVNYFNVSHFDTSYLTDVSLSEVDNVLLDDKLLLSINFKKYLGITKNQVIRLQGDLSLHAFRTGGFIKFAPGIVSNVFSMQRELSPYIFMSINTAMKLLDNKSIILECLLINVEEGYNVSEVANRIYDYFAEVGVGAKILTLESYLSEDMDLKTRILFSDFEYVQFIVGTLLAFICVILVAMMVKHDLETSNSFSNKQFLPNWDILRFLLVIMALAGALTLIVSSVYMVFILSRTYERYWWFIYLQQENFFFYDKPLGYGITIPTLMFPALMLEAIVFLAYPLLRLEKETQVIH